jgi:hypothetical protein
MADLYFGCLSIFIALYWIAGSCHPWLVNYSKGLLSKEGLYYLLFCVFCTFLRVVDI